MALLQWMIGDVRITRILESQAALPIQGLFPDAQNEVLDQHRSWLVPHFMQEDGQVLLAIQGLVVESAGKRILVDTCIGEHETGFDLGAPSRFLDDLAAAGYPRETIDLVMCTHLHFDHVGWNTMKQGDRWVPSFPNARYLFARTEYEHWQAETSGGKKSEFASTFHNAVGPVVEAGQADLVETDHKLTDEVWLEPTPGHTPGHVAVHIRSGGKRAMITGDLTHHPVQWAETDWRMSADSDSQQAAATRRRLLEEHADGPLLVIGTHYAEPCAGHLVRAEQGGYRFEAEKH